MTTSSELELLMKRSKANGAEDATFFKALLDATIYVHVPKDKRQFPSRFMQFRRSDEPGMLIPFFIDRTHAERSTQRVARVVAMKGRAFLEASRGSTLILNPEETPCCILYPEEVASLLDESYMARVEALSIDEEGALACAPDSIPEGLVEILILVLRDLPFVEVAYVARRASDKAQDPGATLIVLGGDPKLAERAARAVATVLQRQAPRFETGVDMVHFDTSKPPPEWLTDLGLQPVFRRATSAGGDAAGNAPRN